MRVLIEAASSNIGGGLTYLTELVRAIAANPMADRYAVIAPTSASESLQASVPTESVDHFAYPHPPSSFIKRYLWQLFSFPRIAQVWKPDVAFLTSGIAAFLPNIPQVLLLPNSAYFSRQLQRHYRIKRKSMRSLYFRRYFTALSTKFSRVVVFPTVSFSRQYLSYFPGASPKCRVAHFGTPPVSSGQAGVPRIAGISRVREWKARGYPVFLHVSEFATHKNLETLILACSLLNGRGTRFGLVLTISRDRTSEKQEFDSLINLVSTSKLSDRIVLTDHVDYEAISSLYRLADVFVFPSITESFGFPLVEAMAAGLPVVASHTRVNAEICRDAAIYFDTLDPSDCARSLSLAIDSLQYQEELGEISRARALDFSWGKHLDLIKWIFEEVTSETARMTPGGD